MKQLLWVGVFALVAGSALAQGVAPATVTTSPKTLAAGTTGLLTTGGTPYTVVTGPVNGCWIYNGSTAAEQGGIAAAETVNIDPVTTPATALVTTSTIQPGQTWSCPDRLATGV